jgi:acetyl-CoA acyltransferase
MYQKAASLEEVMGAEMIAYPNTKLMCSVNVDGAAAVVLASQKKAKQLGLMSRAVRIRATTLTSDPYSERDLIMHDINGSTKLAARQAYETAGLGPEDLDLVELHDCFATAEIVHYENLGLAAEGNGAELLESRATYNGGRIPVNVSGGLLSKGHPLGATGIANVCEVVSHLRHEAGARQVQNARIGLTHVVGVVGMGGAASIHILEKA